MKRRRSSALRRRYGHASEGPGGIFKEGAEFYKLLKKEFRNVTYDPETGRGSASIGAGGRLEFHASGSDPAVIVQIHPPRLKENPALVMKAVNALNRIYREF